jgi:acetylornithine deacetylase/succinyl-diaminopimelate desuccinylase-like protein
MVDTRSDAIARATHHFDSGGFREELARRIAIPTESQNPERAEFLSDYLEAEIRPAFEALGFTCRMLDERGWPFLFAQRTEDATSPTVLGYGHGDVVRGTEDL